MSHELLAYDDRGRSSHTVDLPGHGESVGSAANPRDVAAGIVATLRAAGVEQSVVIGHSAGAIHATGVAALMRTQGVVNVDQPLLIAPFSGFLQQLAPALRGPDFCAAFAPFDQSIGVHHLPDPERSRLQSTRTIAQDIVLDQVDTPYLYLAGAELPAPVEQHLRAHLPQVDVVAWPGTGHLPQHVDPDAFVRLVSDFVARTSSGWDPNASGPAAAPTAIHDGSDR